MTYGYDDDLETTITPNNQSVVTGDVNLLSAATPPSEGNPETTLNNMVTNTPDQQIITCYIQQDEVNCVFHAF